MFFSEDMLELTWKNKKPVAQLTIIVTLIRVKSKSKTILKPHYMIRIQTTLVASLVTDPSRADTASLPNPPFCNLPPYIAIICLTNNDFVRYSWKEKVPLITKVQIIPHEGLKTD